MTLLFKRKERLTKPQNSTREQVRKYSEGSRVKRERFLRTKMWVSYALSAYTKDRGVIPENIGNNVLITNNLYITRLYMSSIIQIVYLGLETPITFVGELNRVLRENNCKAILDATFKNLYFDVQLKNSGLQARINLWEFSIEDPFATNKAKESAARLLYTVGEVKAGKKLYKSRVYLTVRAKNGTELRRGEELIFRFLTQIGAVYKPISTGVKETLSYISIISDKKDDALKDVPALITTNQTLAQMLPNNSAINDLNGIDIGINVLCNAPFRLDLNGITVARNIYVIAPSGAGKTVLVQNMCASALEQGFNACIMDIKGNEFYNLVTSVGGEVISLRQNSTEYINSFKMNYEDTNDEYAELYFKERVQFSKRQMSILSGVVDPNKYEELDRLLDEFFDYVYTSLGVLASNRSTWIDTQHVNAFGVFDILTQFVSPSVMKRYPATAANLVNTLKTYMTSEGSMSYAFKEELDYFTLLDSRAIMFDFGILENSGSSNINLPLFKLKFLYMRKINDAYVSRNYDKGIPTFKVLEESQIVVRDDDLMRDYVAEYTLRRSQKQTTVLLGNSVAALVESPLSKPLIETTKALFIGGLLPEAIATVIKEFDLECFRSRIEEIGTTPELENAFLFVNNMQRNAMAPIVKVILKQGRAYEMFTPNKSKGGLKK